MAEIATKTPASSGSKKEKEKEAPKTGAVVKSCTCVHPYQDEKYGKGMRVHTIAIKKNPPLECTVCKGRRF